jgi:hypothetical protein
MRRGVHYTGHATAVAHLQIEPICPSLLVAIDHWAPNVVGILLAAPGTSPYFAVAVERNLGSLRDDVVRLRLNRVRAGIRRSAEL